MGLIGEHHPEGFTGGQLSKKEQRELVAIAREIQRRRELVMDTSVGLSGRSGDHDGKALEEEVVVCLGGMFGDAYLVRSRVDSSNGSCVTSSVIRISTIVEEALK